MDQPFRSEVECLRAENERLTACVAELESKPMVDKVPMRWSVAPSFEHDQRGTMSLTGSGILVVVFWLVVAAATIAFVADGLTPFQAPWVGRAAIVGAVIAVAWVRSCIRRVPR